MVIATAQRPVDASCMSPPPDLWPALPSHGGSETKALDEFRTVVATVGSAQLSVGKIGRFIGKKRNAFPAHFWDEVPHLIRLTPN